MSIEEKLEKLADYKDAYNSELAAFNAARDAVLAKVQAELDAIGAEFNPRLTEAGSKIGLIEAEIKLAVSELGKSIKGTRLQAVYSKGRTSWDTDKLTGYAAAHPEVLEFCKTGEPSVSLREVKK